MRVLLDENLDRRLKKAFEAQIEVMTVIERGWGGKKNGELLRLAEQEFDVLVTMDRNLEHQQNLRNFDLRIVLITARSNSRKDVEPLMPEVGRALGRVQPGELVVVGRRERRVETRTEI